MRFVLPSGVHIAIDEQQMYGSKLRLEISNPKHAEREVDLIREIHASGDFREHAYQQAKHRPSSVVDFILRREPENLRIFNRLFVLLILEILNHHLRLLALVPTRRETKREKTTPSVASSRTLFQITPERVIQRPRRTPRPTTTITHHTHTARATLSNARRRRRHQKVRRTAFAGFAGFARAAASASSIALAPTPTTRPRHPQTTHTHITTPSSSSSSSSSSPSSHTHATARAFTRALRIDHHVLHRRRRLARARHHRRAPSRRRATARRPHARAHRHRRRRRHRMRVFARRTLASCDDAMMMTSTTSSTSNVRTHRGPTPYTIVSNIRNPYDATVIIYIPTELVHNPIMHPLSSIIIITHARARVSRGRWRCT